jgi:hypothetical protein
MIEHMFDRLVGVREKLAAAGKVLAARRVEESNLWRGQGFRGDIGGSGDRLDRLLHLAWIAVRGVAEHDGLAPGHLPQLVGEGNWLRRLGAVPSRPRRSYGRKRGALITGKANAP